MKIAIMTWYNYLNYGTALQAVALNQVVKKLGHSVDTIQYDPERHKCNCTPDYSFLKLFHKLVTKLLYCFKSPKYVEEEYGNKGKERLFKNFINQNITFTNLCKTRNDLEQLNKIYSIFICGSDQIWAPNCFDAHYFLDFVIDNNRMVAYAPSIGLNEIKDKYVRNRMQENISRFNYLSIRESIGASVIEKLTGQEACVVCDPTLLLSMDDWIMFFADNNFETGNGYMLVYMLGNDKHHWKNVKKIAKALRLKIKIIPVHETDLDKDGCITEPIGPTEFLKLIFNASYVCTDSFHGLIFSCIFKKQFSVFERFKKNDPINQNSRIYNFLNQVGLEHRIYRSCNDYKVKIDYISVQEKIRLYREKSLSFLKQSLHECDKIETTFVNKHILLDNSLCVGCGACKSVCPARAISIRENEDGFYEAFVDENKCVGCKKCLEVCQFENRFNSMPISKGQLFSYKSHSLETLQHSASGGFASDLTLLSINRAYKVVGCYLDTETHRPRHQIISNVDEIYKLQNSKYLQSDFFSILDEIQNVEDPLVIFGTPCQIAAARKLLSAKTNVCFVDLICHGVPSYNLYKLYLKHISFRFDLNEKSIITIFRDKTKGWRIKFAKNSDGKHEISQSEKDDLFLRMFESSNCYMKSCYDCLWRDCSAADIRIGDYWGPRFQDDSTGVSMVLSMTTKGNQIIELLASKNIGEISNTPISDYLNYQQIYNFNIPVYYNEMQECLRKGNMRYVINKFEKEPYSLSKQERLRFYIRKVFKLN